MRIIEDIIHTAGRFTVGIGIGLALVCAFVIVTTDPRLDAPAAAAPADEVRRDPVVVTISADRHASIHGSARTEAAETGSLDREVKTLYLSRSTS